MYWQILFLVALCFIPSYAYGLGYEVRGHNLEMNRGETREFDFHIIKAVEGTTHIVNVTGPASQYYQYEPKYTAVDGKNIVHFTVTIPVDYEGPKILEHRLIVTQESSGVSSMIVISERVSSGSKITLSDVKESQEEPQEKLQEKPQEEPQEKLQEEPNPVKDKQVINDDVKDSIPEEPSGGIISKPPMQEPTPEPKMKCGLGTELVDGFCSVTVGKNSDQDNGGGCLIATATYGSELSPQVQQLREIRDTTLLQTESGTNFMKIFNSFYYSFSPGILIMSERMLHFVKQ